jgi:wobble nucleotide-excising tRNase
MISSIQLLRNLGQFDSVDSGAQLPLGKVALVYAENGRGKTTLAAVLRSLGTGDPAPIVERRRLGSAHAPHIVINDGNATAVFQNGGWQSRLGPLLVFDDTFVAENICAGMKVETDHRQNLHELIIGSQGVALNATLQAVIDRIEQHNRELQRRSAEIPVVFRGALSVDEFCAVEARDDIEAAIQAAERNLAAGRQSDAIQRQRALTPLALPEFDLGATEQLLARQLPDLQAAAARQVQQHISSLGDRGEAWLGSGMNRIREDSCPFCAQNLGGSPLIAHYQAYFSEAYRDLKDEIDRALQQLQTTHAGDVPAAFERSVAQASDAQRFWSQFVQFEQFAIETVEVARAWKAAYEGVRGALQRKQAAPLEANAVPDEVRQAVDNYHRHRERIARTNETFTAVNREIDLVKESAAAADVPALERDLRSLEIVRNRARPDVDALCNDYMTEKAAKSVTEREREAARAALDTHRGAVFPGYETAINVYLQRFNAGFRLSNVNSVNTRAGSSCSYTVLINAHEVPLNAGDAPGPCFRNAMSSGDRNTLALAFFFASLEHQANLQQVTVVIDDPMTSLDQHRTLATIQEIRRVADRVAQVVILSHSKPFLCQIWEGLEHDERSAMKIARANQASTLAAWDVNQDCITEHDRRHQLASAYIVGNVGVNEREVAAALRPILEAFTRVAHPADFPPGSLLGPFIGICEQREGTQRQIMTRQNRTELRELLDYANRFHHDTNPAWQTEIINDQELASFCRRTLAFTSKA